MIYRAVIDIQIWGTIGESGIPSGKRTLLRAGTRVDVNWTRFGYGYIELPTKGFVRMIYLRQVEDAPLPIPIPSHSAEYFRVPDNGRRYFQCLHDYDTPIWGGKSRAGVRAMPETISLLDKNQFIPLNKAWQEFWFGLLVRSADGSMTDSELILAWESLTADKRAFTDRHSVSQGFCDYILGKNLGAKPISIKTLSCGGNILEHLSGTTVGSRLTFVTLDVRNPPPSIDKIWGNQSVIHWATEINKRDDKSYTVGRFPQLNGKPVPFPIMSALGRNSVRRDRVVELSGGQIYSPYSPPTA